MPFTLPNGSVLTAQSGGHLHFPRLPFPVPFWSAPDSALSHSLLAISPLLQASGSCLLTPTSLSIFAPGDPTPVLVGSKRASENVWRLHIPKAPPFQPPDTLHIPRAPSPPITAFSINPSAPPISNLNDASFTTYISRALGSPSNTTLLNAIRRGYIKIRGLTTKILLRNPPQSLFTSLGHLDLVRKNLRSTKIPPFQPSLALASLRSSTPSLWDSLDPTSLDCPPFIRTVSRDEAAASDLTGQLPVASRRGNKYILITVFRGYIHYTPQKSRSASDYVLSFASILAFFAAHSMPLPSLIVDNETSLECREYFLLQRLPVTFVPPQIHRTNPAERAVRTGKNHLISILSPPTLTFLTTFGTGSSPLPKSPSILCAPGALTLHSLLGLASTVSLMTSPPTPSTHLANSVLPSPVPTTAALGPLTEIAPSPLAPPLPTTAANVFMLSPTALHASPSP